MWEVKYTFSVFSKSISMIYLLSETAFCFGIMFFEKPYFLTLLCSVQCETTVNRNFSFALLRDPFYHVKNPSYT